MNNAASLLVHKLLFELRYRTQDGTKNYGDKVQLASFCSIYV